jgi:hypothetical protein
MVWRTSGTEIRTHQPLVEACFAMTPDGTMIALGLCLGGFVVVVAGIIVCVRISAFTWF